MQHAVAVAIPATHEAAFFPLSRGGAAMQWESDSTGSDTLLYSKATRCVIILGSCLSFWVSIGLLIN